MIETFFIVKILVLSTIAFLLTMAWTPALTHFLYKHKMGKSIRSDGSTPIFSRLHAKKAGTPTMGGVLIWGTTLILAVVFYLIWQITPDSWIGHLNFLTREQTLLPLGALVASALVGLVDDYLNVKKIGPGGGGIRFRQRLILFTLIAIVGAWWFYFKLDWDLLHIPFLGDFNIGWWYIPFFILVIVGTSFSVNQTDGLDGLAGGTLSTAFATLAIIALLQGRVELAAFCAVIVGALLAFLWFNINPARFIMGDTGSMSLGVTLGIVAMLTNTALLLPIMGIIFVIEALSTIVQLVSKKLRNGKKIFLSSPIHHHFEAIGWSEPKIVMRFWVISMVASGLTIAVFVLDTLVT